MLSYRWQLHLHLHLYVLTGEKVIHLYAYVTVMLLQTDNV